MKGRSLMPNNSEPNFAGIEVASNTMRGVVISTAGDVIVRRDATYQPENLIGEIAQLVTALREAGLIKSVGLGIPGLVNRETDRVLGRLRLEMIGCLAERQSGSPPNFADHLCREAG